MDLANNTVLVTGGATGIGLALAVRFLDAGSDVVICGRRADRLAAAQAKYPALHTCVADVASEAGRVALAGNVMTRYPRLNVLVNNAGIQRRYRFASDPDPWSVRREEIAINFEAPLHLTSLLLPHLRKQPRAAVVNVSSGLAFVPVTFAPVYAATKAALHSFTVALRQDLAKTSIEVVEIVPPAVNTDLGGVGLHTQGADVNEFADAVMKRVAAGEVEVGFGFSENVRTASREGLDAAFARLNPVAD